ncbi:MAG: threonine--tRNA ligase [Acidobacteria bacterium]|nr:threonine--tRNA ligase [Acidobacteriota bacterium]
MPAQPESVTLAFPDGAKRTYPCPVTGHDVAAAISPGLAKAALAVRLDGGLRDLTRPITADGAVEIVTGKDGSSEVLELIRHDAAHALAEAAKELYPDVQVTIGPAIEDGFYYDFARDEPFTPADLEAMEARMREIVARDEPITREVWERDDAVRYFDSIGEHYKAEIIRDLPDDEQITIYRQGEFVDLCRGPHLPSTGKLGTAFKLTRLAGAYWRGDSRNAMLQRVYGTAWRNRKELDAHLHRLEEAARRDHRRLGREMSLFHFQEEAAGAVFWHAGGATLYRTVRAYMRRRLEAEGYQEVQTPELVDRKLWERSGHWEKFREHMFVAETEDAGGSTLALKPMNCPGHVQIYKQGLKSYRDLPLRMAEFGCCHRYEPSGALHGLMRLRAFIQDDAHIFCTEDQITSETGGFIRLLRSIYRDFGFEDVLVKFADRPEVRAGDDAVWDRAEAALLGAVEETGLAVEHNPGEGAFYGPKLEFVLADAIGRSWQCGTLQVDFVLPERLDALYTATDGERRRPVMLHRAILGSFERFIGILIEHYAGNLPLWLAPRQVVVATITSDADDYAREVHAALLGAGLHAELDLRNEKIGYKVREHSLAKVPVLLVVGRREAEGRQVAVRRLGESAQPVLALDECVPALAAEAQPPDATPGAAIGMV